MKRLALIGLLAITGCATVKPDIHTMYMPKGSVLMWEQKDGSVATFKESERLTFVSKDWEAAGRFTAAGLYWDKSPEERASKE